MHAESCVSFAKTKSSRLFFDITLDKKRFSTSYSRIVKIGSGVVINDEMIKEVGDGFGDTSHLCANSACVRSGCVVLESGSANSQRRCKSGKLYSQCYLKCTRLIL